MKKTFLKFTLMSIVAASAFFACSKDDAPGPRPTVTDVSPTEVAVGDEITITGTNLDRVTSVGFATSANDLISLVSKTNFVSASATSIKVIIPVGVTFPTSVGVIAGDSPIQLTSFTLTAKATQAQKDALAFLMCANDAFVAHPDEQSPEYQQAVGVCLQNNLTVASLSFNSESNPNNDYTTELFFAIAETVNTMYQGQTDEAKAASIAGIHSMIYYFYLSLQGV